MAVNDFEEHRDHLRAVAVRMLGSRTDADDAVQEAWLRMNRSDVGDVRNLRGWLTTVVARICLDMLRARGTRREEPLDEVGPDVADAGVVDPEQEALLADSVGVALLVVLQTLSPPERLALVLHDMFDLPFTEIGPIVGRTPNAAAQLASRARRRVRGKAPEPGADLVGQRRVVDAFLAAARDGDLGAVLLALDADVVLTADAAITGTGEPLTIRGAHAVAARARMFAANASHAEPALVDGSVGLVVAPDGRLSLALRFAVHKGVIAGIEIVGDPRALRMLDLALLD
jgi:RNA polymerase sigma factor (sigma-70 family)